MFEEISRSAFFKLRMDHIVDLLHTVGSIVWAILDGKE